MEPSWKDETSYSRHEREATYKGQPLVPRTWELTIATGQRLTRIAVTRHIDYGDDVWLLRCFGLLSFERALKEKDVERAKEEALRVVCQEVGAVFAAVEKALGKRT